MTMDTKDDGLENVSPFKSISVSMLNVGGCMEVLPLWKKVYMEGNMLLIGGQGARKKIPTWWKVIVGLAW